LVLVQILVQASQVPSLTYKQLVGKAPAEKSMGALFFDDV